MRMQVLILQIRPTHYHIIISNTLKSYNTYALTFFSDISLSLNVKIVVTCHLSFHFIFATPFIAFLTSCSYFRSFQLLIQSVTFFLTSLRLPATFARNSLTNAAKCGELQKFSIQSKYTQWRKGLVRWTA